jgi:hypothetical protein
MAEAARRKGLMRYFFCIIMLFLSNFKAFADEISFEKLPYNKSIKENILHGDVFSESRVKTIGEKPFQAQSLNFSIAGIHPKSCEYALKKLSLYEEFSHYLDFVKISKYDDKKQEIDFLIEHSLFPYPFELTFILPRVRSVGTYPFRFEVGILKDLRGMIYVQNYKDRCLFYTTANWYGPHTGFPSFLLEVFSQTLSKISMELLFRISSSLGR